jgi:hypothetical protein
MKRASIGFLKRLLNNMNTRRMFIKWKPRFTKCSGIGDVPVK